MPSLKTALSKDWREKLKSNLSRSPKIKQLPLKKNKKILSLQSKITFYLNGITSLSIAMLFFLTLVKASKKEIIVAACMLAIGGLLYSLI
jgi:hypothetical protein